MIKNDRIKKKEKKKKREEVYNYHFDKLCPMLQSDRVCGQHFWAFPFIEMAIKDLLSRFLAIIIYLTVKWFMTDSE